MTTNQALTDPLTTITQACDGILELAAGGLTESADHVRLEILVGIIRNSQAAICDLV